MTFDDFLAFIALIGALIVGLLVIVLIWFSILWIKNEIAFYRAPSFPVRATLLSQDFIPSTRQTHVAPVFSGKGRMSMAVYSTGHSERYTTMWDCGKYGRLTSDQERVFRFAQEESVLLLKQVGNETRIWDIR